MVRSFATPYSFALTEIGDRTRSQADGKGVGPNCQPEDFEADSFFIRNGISAFRCKLCPLTCCSERVPSRIHQPIQSEMLQGLSH